MAHGSIEIDDDDDDDDDDVDDDDDDDVDDDDDDDDVDDDDDDVDDDDDDDDIYIYISKIRTWIIMTITPPPAAAAADDRYAVYFTSINIWWINDNVIYSAWELSVPRLMKSCESLWPSCFCVTQERNRAQVMSVCGQEYVNRADMGEVVAWKVPFQEWFGHVGMSRLKKTKDSANAWLICCEVCNFLVERS